MPKELRKNLDPCISTADSKGTPYHVRYKRIREATGKSPQDVAALIEIPVHLSYDLEAYEGQLNRQLSLGKLSKLSSVLEIRARLIFDDADEIGRSLSPEELCAKIKDHLKAKGMSIAEFEDIVGFVIRPSLRDPLEVTNWNVDCLRSVCAEIGVNWHNALP